MSRDRSDLPLIEARSITKAFRIPSVRRDTLREHVLDAFRPRPSEELRVLKSVTFDVHRGEALGIMGRNGSGKSTLLKIVAGIYHLDGGTLRIRAPLTPLLELGVGWNPELDAIDNIFLIGSVLGLSLRQIHAGIDDILAFGELERFANLKLRHYSSGMASRLAYAVAFHAVRDILVLDEIFAVGDAGFRTRCEARYRELSSAGHTVILVSHDPRAVSEFCSRALLIEHGDIVMDGKPQLVCEEYLRLTALSGTPSPDTDAGDGVTGR